MDNRELVDAASALIHWANSQELKPSHLEKIMAKVQAKIITDRMGIRTDAPPPDQDSFKQEIMGAQELLMHELVTRIFKIAGRK